HGVELARESATDLVMKIGATVGLSLVGSKIAITAGKLVLPGLGGLIAAPFMFASTLAIGAVARAYFESGGKLGELEMKRVYEETVAMAKSAFDPRKARSAEARTMAEEAARQEQAGAATPRETKATASVDDLAERLAKLDELYERGAISERDYERRKQQILDEV
ncbi:MAG TPA: SHOCT domain-containing protein, partial [Sandaracinaceae bacterium]